jgi:hypothetical protein
MRRTQLKIVFILVVLVLTAWTQRAYTRSNQDTYFTIQMASFQQEQSAIDAVDKLKQKNLDVFYHPILMADKGTWYRLYINRYKTIQAAQDGISKLREKGIISDAYVRRLQNAPQLSSEPAAHKPVQQIAKEQSRPSTEFQVKSKQPPMAAKAPRPDAEAPRLQHDQLRIHDISVRRDDKVGDAAIIQGDRYFWPVTHLKNDGGKTRLQVQILNTGPFEKSISPRTHGGRYIQNGQAVYDADRNTLVLSLDLSGAENYRITQSFNQVENIFSLLVSK